MKNAGENSVTASTGIASRLDTRLDRVRKMMRMVVGFRRSFFSEQSTTRAKVLRIVPKTEITMQMTPPMTR